LYQLNTYVVASFVTHVVPCAIPCASTVLPCSRFVFSSQHVPQHVPPHVPQHVPQHITTKTNILATLLQATLDESPTYDSYLSLALFPSPSIIMKLESSEDNQCVYFGMTVDEYMALL
jgi:hypothetical protein